MLCRSPFVKDRSGKVFRLLNTEEHYQGVPFPCGQCLPCRIYRRKVWTLRMILESKSHPFMSYVTLTYSPDGLVRTDKGYCTLEKRDVQLYLKKLRKKLKPIKIRYFCCGEYGGLYGRPHYHLILFGVSPRLRSHVAAMKESWTNSDMDAPLGYVKVEDCPLQAMQYAAGYVTKKFVSKKDPYERVPEFILTSRRPGLGAPALMELAKMLENPKLKDKFKVLENGLPGVLKLGGRSFPLGRFGMDKLKDWLWLVDTPGAKEYILQMRDRWFKTPDKFDDENAIYGKLAMALMEDDAQKAKTIIGKHKIYSSRGKR